MGDIAIRADNLGKQYRLGQQDPYKTIREAICDAAALSINWITRKNEKSPNKNSQYIWALRKSSFEVEQGEVVGMIGRNGSGKSTLLKILSRITTPTEGTAEIYGRVGSLLEVGTGFHPELTGRENIYLSGSILGMRKREIDERFDAIVKFSEIGRFLDTPVKRYSSGMYVRLAFSVAAHLEPDVLLIDEVLAVGDASFQKKCLNKMQEVGREGRSVLFVSHNMPAITRLCPRTILLEGGRIQYDGPSHKVVGIYMRSGVGTTAARDWPDVDKAPGDDIVKLCAVRVKDEHGEILEAADIRQPIGIEMEFEVIKPGHILVPNHHVFNEDGTCVFIASDHDPDWKRKPRPKGRYISTAWIPGNLLSEGMLIVSSAISTMDPICIHFFEQDAVSCQVIDTLDGDSARGDYAGSMPGVVRPLLKWTTQFRPSIDEASILKEAV